jgi:hypothetical protein
MADNCWQRKFEDPIPLPKGRQLVTLKEAADYIMKLPKNESDLPEWEARSRPRSTSSAAALTRLHLDLPSGRPSWCSLCSRRPAGVLGPYGAEGPTIPRTTKVATANRPAVRGELALSTFLEREDLGALGGLRGLPGFALFNGVCAVHNKPVGIRMTLQPRRVRPETLDRETAQEKAKELARAARDRGMAYCGMA